MHFARSAFALVAPLLIIPSLLAAQTYPSKDDPRSKLKPGRLDADTAAKNMRLVSFTPKAAAFDTARGLTFINSDLAFGDKYVYQGNFSGFTIWDVSDPTSSSRPFSVTSSGIAAVWMMSAPASLFVLVQICAYCWKCRVRIIAGTM